MGGKRPTNHRIPLPLDRTVSFISLPGQLSLEFQVSASYKCFTSAILDVANNLQEVFFYLKEEYTYFYYKIFKQYIYAME